MKLLSLCMGFCIVGNVFAAEQNETLKTIHARKSVRQYIDRQVTKDQLNVLVKAGMAAPTAGDKRPWSFVVIDDRKKLDALAEVLPYGKMLKSAPAAIVVCGNPDKFFPGVESAFWIQDCSAATENILLAVESMGLGAVWIGVYPTDSKIKGVQFVLGIPEKEVPLNVLSIGYPAGMEKPKDKFNEKQIHWNKW